VIADPSDAPQIAQTIDAEGTPVGVWGGFSVKSINDLDLAYLYALLRGDADGKRRMDLLDEFTHLHAVEEGLTIQLIPPAFVDLLATLAEDRLLPVAEKWSEA